MIFLLIFLTVSVQWRLVLSLEEWSPERGEKKEVRERMNHIVYIITKENKTHSLMESHTFSTRREDPGSNVVSFVEKGDAKNEEMDNNDILVVFSNKNTKQEEDQTHSSEVSNQTPYKESFSDIFINIRKMLRGSDFVSNNTKTKDQNYGTSDIVIQIEVRRKEELNSNILKNKHEPNVHTIINTLKKYSENETFTKILNTPIYYGDIENMKLQLKLTNYNKF